MFPGEMMRCTEKKQRREEKVGSLFVMVRAPRTFSRSVRLNFDLSSSQSCCLQHPLEIDPTATTGPRILFVTGPTTVTPKNEETLFTPPLVLAHCRRSPLAHTCFCDAA